MNAQLVKSLALDALYQVLDNWVFRILAILTVIPILAVTILQFREDGIVFLFGVETWDYDNLASMLGAGSSVGLDLRTATIEGLVSLLFNVLAGGIGVVFCIAATAFFVPRMIEKGAADILFHKPVSRLLLYLSRYVAGLMFVGVLSSLMVIGVYVGLLLFSGYNDPGILWAVPALIYMFGLIHAVSMMVAVPTRSTVAAILITVLFFFGNGCLHQGWQVKEMIALSIDQQETMEEVEEDEEDDEGGGNSFGRAALWTLDALHLVLPKTGDADVISKKLRKAISSGPAHEDVDTTFRILNMPEGFDEVPAPEGSLGSQDQGWLELLGNREFAAQSEDGSGFELWKREKRQIETPRTRGGVRIRPETLRQAGDALEQLLENTPGATELERFSANPVRTAVSDGDDEGDAAEDAPADELLLGFGNACFRWKSAGPNGSQESLAVVFRTGEWSFTLLYRSSAIETARTEAAAIGAEMRFAQAEETDFYTSRFTMSAPPSYNILYSVGSSIAFAAAMLLLGWWRLSRIDF